jgi:hypothetical protein
MNAAGPQQLEIAVGNAGSVSALLIRPAKARACFVLAMAAGGGGTTHSFMEAAQPKAANAAWRAAAISFYMEKAASGRPA